MKKIILAIVAITLLINYVKAQENVTDFRERFLFGFKAGLNYSNVYDTEGEEFRADPKFGFAGGIFVAIPIGMYLGVHPEILLSQKGFKATGVLLGNTYEFTRTSNYIDVPILFALKPSEFLTIVAGPQYSYLFNQKDVFTNGTTSMEQETEVDINLKNIVLSARAGWDILKNNGSEASTTPRYKNVWYQATIGYRF